MTEQQTLSPKVYWGLILAGLALYSVTLPINYSESVDRHAYALWAETLPLAELIDTRSILFTVLNRGLFLAAAWAGFDLSALALGTGYSVICGALSWALMARLLNRHCQASPEAAVLGALLLGTAYGFWRFAMETEVYVAAIFLILACLNLLLDRLSEPEARASRFLLPGFLSGLAVMFYQPILFALFLAVPVLFWSGRRLLPFFLYGAAGTVTVLLSYFLAFFLTRDLPVNTANLLGFIGSRNTEFHAVPFGLVTLAKAGFAISHTWLSANWIFGIEPITQFFQRQFPATEILLKVQTASHFRPYIYVPLVLAPVIVVAAGLLVRASFRGARRERGLPMASYFFAWLILYAIVAGRLGPGISEVWLTPMPALMGLGVIWVLDPALRRGSRGVGFVLLASILAWNWFGGIGMLRNPQGDFLALQSAWLRENAVPSDVIVLTNAKWKNATYLRHVLNTQVENIDLACDQGISMEANMLQAILDSATTKGGRVFVFDDFVHPPTALAHVSQCADLADNAAAISSLFADRTRLVDGVKSLALYQLMPGS